jgi:hypothetical protein
VPSWGANIRRKREHLYIDRSRLCVYKVLPFQTEVTVIARVDGLLLLPHLEQVLKSFGFG